MSSSFSASSVAIAMAMQEIMVLSDLKKISDEQLEHRISAFQGTPTHKLQNWARTFEATPERIYTPHTIADTQLIVEAARRARVRVRAMGVWHSPSDLACSEGWIVIMSGIAGVISIDKEDRTITTHSGTLLRDINQALDVNNLAMPILGSISDQTIAGCLATATHGSGIDHHCMSSYVHSLSILVASGEVLECSRTLHPHLFNATLCSLGATGIILSVVLSVEEKFNLHQVTTAMSFDEYTSSPSSWLDRWRTAPYVKAFWLPQTGGVSLMQSYKAAQNTEKHQPQAPVSSTLFSFLLQPLLLVKRYVPAIAPLLSHLAWRCVFGQHQQRTDTSCNIFNMDCGLLQYTTEWSVPLSQAYECMLELNEWLVDENDVDFPLEVRISKADDILLSPANKHVGNQVETHFMWIGLIKYKPFNCRVRYRRIFRTFEDILRKYNGRAHWAKHSTQTPQEVGEKYSGLPKFMEIIHKYDEHGIFLNPFIDRHLICEKGDTYRHFKTHQVEAFGF
ncbi:hypothetical protein E3P92_00326 [Wallemia ichthyophaga]|nr:hypothetical protein E3P98_02517 [Wallemia ichthyophaga]TIB18877.1 hypothetical protein E3P92_00326 [Wallemia ichthyophaga]